MPIAIITINLVDGRTSPGPWPSATIQKELEKLVKGEGNLLDMEVMSFEEWEDSLPDGWTNVNPKIV